MSSITYNRHHKHGALLQEMINPIARHKFLSTKVSFNELYYVEKIVQKAIANMKSFKNPNLWTRSNKYFTITITKDHHWMSYTPHYEVKVKFSKVDFDIDMKFVHVMFSRDIALI